MRKFASVVFVSAMLGGSLAMAAGQAAAVENEGVESRAAACVTAVGWSSEGSSRYVTVKNSCSSTKCFSVTMAFRTDPEFSVGANKQQKFRYGGTLGVEGTGIKNIGC